MIVSVTSSLSTFKSMTFHPGLNVLLADVTAASTNRQTRNSVGKTSLVEIVHFLLGSEAGKQSLFKKPQIVGHSFTGVFELGGRRLSVTRQCLDDREVTLSDVTDTVSGREPDAGMAETVTLDRWKAALGSQWFAIPPDRSDTFEGKNAPTFRSLIGYFARRRKSGGYATIEKQNENQQPWDWQVNLSYLMGLGWEVSREFQELRARKKISATLKEAVKDGELGSLFGTVAQIRPELARTAERISRLRAQVAAFRVHESYRELAERAGQLKDAMSDATVELASLEATVSYLDAAIRDEAGTEYASVERLYLAAGIELPGVALRRFDEVRSFQASVSENRRRHLAAQAENAKERMTAVDAALRAYDEERSGILLSLEGKGAFEDLTRLQEELARLTSREETLQSKLRHASMLENSIAQHKLESAGLELRLQEDLKRHDNAIRRATVMVDEAITALYDDHQGNLIVAASRNGPKIEIIIQGGGNLGGIDMMKIFCFDTMLFRVAAERFSGGPGFLFHDSHLFDGVDARQVRGAIMFGAEVAEGAHGQYIVALNSDEFERTGLRVDPLVGGAVLPVRLTDDETGGLFGFRFD